MFYLSQQSRKCPFITPCHYSSLPDLLSINSHSAQVLPACGSLDKLPHTKLLENCALAKPLVLDGALISSPELKLAETEASEPKTRVESSITFWVTAQPTSTFLHRAAASAAKLCSALNRFCELDE